MGPHQEWITWDPAKFIDKIPMWSEYLQKRGGKVREEGGGKTSPPTL